MQTNKHAVTRLWGFGLSVLALAVCGTSAALLNTEALVAKGFDDVLSAERPAITSVEAKPLAVAQSEEFWLGQARIFGAQPVSLRAPLAVGDLITIASKGEDRQLEVLDVRAFDESGTHIVSGPVASRLLAVTCRDAKHPDRAPIRFIIEADGAGLPAQPQKRQSAL